jgi:hypothetical protein
MPYFKDSKQELLEKGISALCYISCGLIGLLYVLVSGKNARTAPLFYFHFLQSIILGILSFLLGWTGSVLKQIAMGITGLIFGLFPGGTLVSMVVGSAIDWFLFAINSVLYVLMIYGVVFALLGKYAEIPVLSKLVRKNL